MTGPDSSVVTGVLSSTAGSPGGTRPHSDLGRDCRDAAGEHLAEEGSDMPAQPTGRPGLLRIPAPGANEVQMRFAPLARVFTT